MHRLLDVKCSESKNNGSVWTGSFQPDEDGIAMLQSMGFTRSQCIKALKNTDNNVERAADWIFSHPDEINADDDAPSQPSSSPVEAGFVDGPSRKKTSRLRLASCSYHLQCLISGYELTAFVSHMGTSTSVGHYVCHIKKEGRWVIFNDEKVAISENPPFELGYLYLFRRLGQP